MQYKQCPNCGQICVLAMTICGRCSYQFAAPAVTPGIRAASGVMWLLMILAWVLCVTPEMRPIGNMIDIVSICIAGCLICMGGKYGRIHAWSRIGFEAIAISLMVAYAFSLMGTQNVY